MSPRRAAAPAAPVVVDDPYLLIRQARRNAWRTFLQGLAIDVLIAIAIVITQVVAAPLEQWQGWAAIGVALARSVAGAIASYVMRRFVDGSRIPTPLPIAPEAAPAELEAGGVADRGAGELRLILLWGAAGLLALIAYHFVAPHL